MGMTTLIEPSTDHAAFSAAAERHRRELHVHCYRMLASFDEAEDLVQETFERAWRRRETFAGRASLRAWLYGIATNACLDAIARRPAPAAGEVAWLQPYPDALLDELPGGEEPHAVAVARETIELAFVVAVQRLPSTQRAAFVLRDVLELPAREAAAALDTTVQALNSLLQRARTTMREHLPTDRRTEWRAAPASADERELVERYVAASELNEVAAFDDILRDDLRWSMPPQPGLTTSRDEAYALWTSGGFGTPEYDDVRAFATQANRQPAVALYLRRPGAEHHTPMAVDLLLVKDGAVAEIVTFGPSEFPRLGLPAEFAG